MRTSGPIRVLFVNDHLGFPGGVVHGSTTYLTNTLPSFDPSRVHASLAIFRPYHPAAERLEELGVSVRFFSRSKWDPRALPDLLKLVREWDIDLLHVNGKKAHFLGRLAGLRTNTPTIIHLHFQYRPKPAWLHRALADRTAMALTVSGVLREQAIAEFGMDPDRARVAYNGVQVEKYSSPAAGARARIRDELGLDDSRHLVTVTGRIMEEGSSSDKGQAVAIRAMVRLRETHPAVVLALIGDGPGRGECEALVEELELGDRVQLLGQRGDVPDLLAASDVAVVPSAHPEAFGYTGLEAMCAGRPLVASRVGGLVEVLGEGERGVLVPPNDPDELASGISWMIEHPDEARRLAEEGWRFASSLTVDRHVNQLMDVYEEIREERAAPAVR